MTENIINPLKIGVFMWYDDKIKDYAEINYKIKSLNHLTNSLTLNSILMNDFVCDPVQIIFF